MSIVVTGATGALGRLVVEELLNQVPAERVAVVVRSETLGDRRLRHSELEERANRLAHVLQDCGVGAGDNNDGILITGSGTAVSAASNAR